MKKITDKQYKEYIHLLRCMVEGKLLTPNGLRIIVEANNFDATEIGNHMLNMYSKLREDFTD